MNLIFKKFVFDESKKIYFLNLPEQKYILSTYLVLSIFYCGIIFSACGRKAPAPWPITSTIQPSVIPAPQISPPSKLVPVATAQLYLEGLKAYHYGQYQQAISKLSAVVKTDTSFSEAYWALGEIYYDLEKYDLSINNYKLALNYDPQMIDAALQLSHIYLGHREYQEAQKQLEYILALVPRHKTAKFLLKQCQGQAAKYHLQQGRLFLIEGNSEQAIVELNLALNGKPNFYQAWLELGRIQQNTGKVTQAIESYEKALAIRNNLSIVWNEIGKLYLQSAAYDKARHAFQRSLILDPNQPDIQALLKEAQNNYYHLMNLPEEYLQISYKQSLTRGELAAILAINLRSFPNSTIPENKGTPIIADIANHWAEQFIRYVVTRGWMQPYPNHDFLPYQAVSRGELAAILDGIVADKTTGSSVEARPFLFNDITSENQYYNAIMKVSSLGLLFPYQKQEGAFLPDKIVSGVEGLEIIDRLKYIFQ